MDQILTLFKTQLFSTTPGSSLLILAACIAAKRASETPFLPASRLSLTPHTLPLPSLTSDDNAVLIAEVQFTPFAGASLTGERGSLANGSTALPALVICLSARSRASSSSLARRWNSCFCEALRAGRGFRV